MNLANSPSSSNSNLTKLAGVVERITYHNEQNGWAVLKVSPFNEPQKLATVVVHQARVFAGSTMEFWGTWTHHSKHGQQFKAERAIEKKPASSAALEKYLGSGMIKGVGPKTASRIVKYFKERTLSVFEGNIDELLQVPGIATRKLIEIKNSWKEHQAIRDVMIFLQGYGISTLFSVKIFKTYGNKAVEIVSQNPYQLARDIYGIGFFSADKIALSMGFERDGQPRIEAGIKHVLAASRDDGHCYLSDQQIVENTINLLQTGEPEKILLILNDLLARNEIKMRKLPRFKEGAQTEENAYYSNSLFFDEAFVAKKIKIGSVRSIEIDSARLQDWVEKFCSKNALSLSPEQKASVVGIASRSFSILTGGPGCGKTTTTQVLVKLLEAMNKKVVLAAPTGRAAQRMSEVIGREAKTIHRLLGWAPEKNAFKKGEDEPLDVHFLIIDETSMLDVHLAASLLKAVPVEAQVLFIGDPDQLPSVGAGSVLFDLLQASTTVSSFRLTQVFRQAQESMIVQFAHQMNQGEIPKIASPLQKPELWHKNVDCLFIDAEEATQEQIQFLHKAKVAIRQTLETGEDQLIQEGEKITGILKKENHELQIEPLLVQEFATPQEIHAPVLNIPEKFKKVDLLAVHKAKSDIEELKAVIQKVHPWSALHYGFTALETVLRIYTKTIPEYLGKEIEIQVLTPQVRGSLGSLNLNRAIQHTINPASETKREIRIGERVFREGDRVIQTRNNYELGVFNGDIGKILEIDSEAGRCLIQFGRQTPVAFEMSDLPEISLAYAITIHKSQGSEFGVVIIPVATQHFKMLFRNLIYTGLTRARKLCVFVGSRKALSMAVKQVDSRKRQTALTFLVEGEGTE